MLTKKDFLFDIFFSSAHTSFGQIAWFMLFHDSTHTYPFFVYQPISYQIRIKVTICQTDSFMTIKCELCKSGSSILSDRLIIKLSKICSLCTYVDQMNRKQKFDVLLQRQFYNIFTNVLFIIFQIFHQYIKDLWST